MALTAQLPGRSEAVSRIAAVDFCKPIDSLYQCATKPVHPTSVAMFRIAFGIVALVAISRFFAYGWAGAGFDLTIVAWMLWGRSRPLAFAVLIVFHLITGQLFMIGVFPYMMIAASLIFFSPEWPRRLIARRR